jgi:hypothetical protein
MRPALSLTAVLVRVFGALMLGATIAHAQSAPDVVRGRVTDDSARAVVGATVMITRGPDRLTQQAVTDSTGAYRS